MTIKKTIYIFISSNSSLVFLTFSNLSAKIDPLVCVDLVFWKELKKCFFFYFFPNCLFSRCWAFWPLSVLVVETNYPLHTLKKLSFHDIIFASELIVEEGIKAIYVLVVDTKCDHFLKQLFNGFY